MPKKTININVNKSNYGCLNALFDLFMLVITGGLWLIWIIARYLRTH